MEACFLSRSTEAALFKSKQFLCPKIKPNPKSTSTMILRKLFHSPTPPSLRSSCSLPSSNHEYDDDDDNDDKPMVSADWRSFRARLVAAERSPTGPSSSAVRPMSIAGSIGSRWVHEIREPEKGCLLIATEKLEGAHIFERAVILLLETADPLGPTGVILNRPSLMSIKEANAKSWVMDPTGTFTGRPLFFGGPLQDGLFLVSNTRGGEGGVFEEVMKGLYVGRKENVGCAAQMVKRGVVEVDDFSFFDGYCGWGKEQLLDEIRAGCWTLAACSPTVIGGLCNLRSSELWEELLGLTGS